NVDEWLASLQGAAGADGTSVTVLDVAKAAGYDNVDEWLASLKGAAGADGQDVTVSSITYRDMGDYGLFFFEAVGDAKPRIIYIPMDVQTPTSITMVTEAITVEIDKTTTFSVIVNPTANAKDIVEFNLVAFDGYATRSAGSVYGVGVDGLSLSSVEDPTVSGLYTITVACTKEVILGQNEVLFVAAKYTVDSYNGTSGYVDAYTYAAYLADESSYNLSSESELISSTPLYSITTNPKTYEDMTDTDVNALLGTWCTYDNKSTSYSVLSDKYNSDLDNIESIVVSSVTATGGVAASYTLEANVDTDGILYVSIDKAVSAKATYTVVATVTDKNKNQFTCTLNVEVYPSAALIADNSSKLIETWLPANTTDGVNGSVAVLNGIFKSNFTYDFSKPTVSASFTDDYKIGSLGVDVTDEIAAELVNSAVYDDSGNGTIEVYMNNSSELLLQPGTYTITMVGSAYPTGTDLDRIDATLMQTIKVQAPKYTFNFSGLVTGNSYVTSTWGDIDVTDLVDQTGATADGLYPYAFATDASNIVVANSKIVRSMVAVNGGELDETKTVSFLDLSTAATFKATVSFYCELNTGVMFPIYTAVDNYSTIDVRYNMITLNDVSLAYTTTPIASNAIVENYVATVDFSASQDGGTITSTSPSQPQINDDDYSSTVVYSYKLKGDVLYYANALATAATLPSGNAFTQIISVNEASGEITVDGIILNNLEWSSVADGVSYGQVIEVTATDAFGTAVTDTFEFKITK
ncbi:MAG: hypothetical protein R3Y70_06865, partial [Rikenellaceae bacterium]